MPTKPKPDNGPMRPRMFRADDPLYDAALREAHTRGESLSEAIRAFLRRYIKRGQS